MTLEQALDILEMSPLWLMLSIEEQFGFLFWVYRSYEPRFSC